MTTMMMILLINDINNGKNEDNDENDNGCFGHFSLKLLTFSIDSSVYFLSFDCQLGKN